MSISLERYPLVLHVATGCQRTFGEKVLALETSKLPILLHAFEVKNSFHYF